MLQRHTCEGFKGNGFQLRKCYFKPEPSARDVTFSTSSSYTSAIPGLDLTSSPSRHFSGINAPTYIPQTPAHQHPTCSGPSYISQYEISASKLSCKSLKELDSHFLCISTVLVSGTSVDRISRTSTKGPFPTTSFLIKGSPS